MAFLLPLSINGRTSPNGYNSVALSLDLMLKPEHHIYSLTIDVDHSKIKEKMRGFYVARNCHIKVQGNLPASIG
jgi:hypothetical protein